MAELLTYLGQQGLGSEAPWTAAYHASQHFRKGRCSIGYLRSTSFSMYEYCKSEVHGSEDCKAWTRRKSHWLEIVRRQKPTAAGVSQRRTKRRAPAANL